MISARAAAVSCLLAATAVGASIAVTPSIAAFPVLAGQAARYALGALVLLLALPRLDPRPRPRLTSRQTGRLVVAAATGSAGFNVLLVAATRHADPAAIGAVVGASPVVLAILGAPRARRLPRPRRGALAGAVLATSGVVVLHGGGTGTAAGLVLSCGVLACEVCFTLVAAPLLPVLGPARLSAWSCAVAATLLAAASLLTGERLRPPTAPEVTALTYQGLVMTAVAFVLWYRGVQRLGPDRAGVTMAAAPLAAAGLAAVLGTGSLTPATALGAALVAGGVAAALGVSPRQRTLSSSPWAQLRREGRGGSHDRHRGPGDRVPPAGHELLLRRRVRADGPGGVWCGPAEPGRPLQRQPQPLHDGDGVVHRP